MPEVAAVVGVGPGVGGAVARRFAKEGFAMALLARRTEVADAMAAELGNGARGFSADATDATDLTRALGEVRQAMGPPSVLIYNPSRWLDAPGLALSPDELSYDLALCVTGALVALHAVADEMRAAGRGTVIVTGGGLALAPGEGWPAPGLAVGKSGARALVYALAKPLAEDGIHLCTVTIAGTVEEGGPFDPEKIAEAFWALHAEPRGRWSVETIFRDA